MRRFPYPHRGCVRWLQRPVSADGNPMRQRLEVAAAGCFEQDPGDQHLGRPGVRAHRPSADRHPGHLEKDVAAVAHNLANFLDDADDRLSCYDTSRRLTFSLGAG